MLNCLRFGPVRDNSSENDLVSIEHGFNELQKGQSVTDIADSATGSRRLEHNLEIKRRGQHDNEEMTNVCGMRTDQDNRFLFSKA